jgi:hypothetical protein
MKNFIALVFSVALLCSLPSMARCTEKPKTRIASVIQKGKDVAITLTSSRKFIFANNIYILHIGSRHFEDSKDLSTKGKGAMTFFIPNNDFKSIPEGANMFLTYGQISNDEENEEQYLEEQSKQGNRRIWSLGKFSSKMLTK